MYKNYKYYIPEIEEFHIGFEYECCKCLSKSSEEIILDNIFIKYKFEVEDFLDYGDFFLNRCISDGMVRVKYLDKEDIKSFGFNKLNHRHYSSAYTKGDYWIVVLDKTRTMILRDNGMGMSQDYFYNGNIKNKSELNTLLKRFKII